jgi:hypothetical protein
MRRNNDPKILCDLKGDFGVVGMMRLIGYRRPGVSTSEPRRVFDTVYVKEQFAVAATCEAPSTELKDAFIRA